MPLWVVAFTIAVGTLGACDCYESHAPVDTTTDGGVTEREPDAHLDATVAPDARGAEPDAGATDGGSCSNPDRDGDRHGSVVCGGDDCDDGDATVHPGAAEAGWVDEVIDEDGANYLSLALDGQGSAHLSYQASGLWVATNASGAWVLEQVDASSNGWLSSLALDEDGSVHVAHCWRERRDQAHTFIRYSSNRSGAWIHEELSEDLSFASYPSLEIDGSGVVHVAFYSTDGLGLWRKLADGWEQEMVDDRDGNGMMPSLAFDSAGIAHISYGTAGGLPGIWYATNASGSWATSIVDADLGQTSALAIDPLGVVHVVYGSAELRHAVKQPEGDWRTETIDTAPSDSVALAFDAEGAPHVTYLAFSGESELRSATIRDGVWTIEVLSTGGSYGETAIQVDGAGVPHVGYMQPLHYATRLPDLPDGIDRDCDGADL